MMDRYNMCKDQPAQIDCRNTTCIYYKGSETCFNVSPAITLNEDNHFTCWSKKEKSVSQEDLDLDLRQKIIDELEKRTGIIPKLEYFDLGKVKIWFKDKYVIYTYEEAIRIRASCLNKTVKERIDMTVKTILENL